MTFKSVTGKNWKLKNVDSNKVLKLIEEFSLSEIISKLLVIRNISDKDVKNFLNPDLKKHLPSPSIFKDMNIGTAKPDKEVLKSIKHHLVDIKNPDDNYNVGDFYKDVCKLINSIHLNERIPLLVGGTLMYFNQLYNKFLL